MPSKFKKSLTKALEHGLNYLDDLDNFPAYPQASLDELRSAINKPLNEEGLPPEQVIDDLVNDTKNGIVGNSGGRFFGWVIGGAVPAALAADWMTSVWDQNSGMFTVAPAASVVEETCGNWLIDILDLPPKASFAFVTGCQMAHVTCLAAARNSILKKHGWDVETRGLNGSPKIKIITSDQKHGTIDRAVRLLGFGTDCLEFVPDNDDGGINVELMDKKLAEFEDNPKIVLLQAGDVNTGFVDNFEELIPTAHKHNAWVHIDGAFGLWASASAKHKHLMKGVNKADSWATDGHKWLNVPYDSGFAFIVDRESHYNAMAQKAAYITHIDEARDQMSWNPEFSRRGRGFASYAAIRELGRKGIEELINRNCEQATAIVDGISSLDGAEVVSAAMLNQGLVRFLDPKENATVEDHNERTKIVVEKINNSGEAFFSPTTYKGTFCMRVSVSSWLTNDNDVKRTINIAEKVLKELNK